MEMNQLGNEQKGEESAGGFVWSSAPYLDFLFSFP